MKRLGLIWILSWCACGGAQVPERSAETPPVDPIAAVDADELFTRGVELAQAGDLVRAEQYLATAIIRGYSESAVMPLLMRVCVAASRLRVALEYATGYLSRHPDDWALRYLVATIHNGLGDDSAAQRELEVVVELAPDEPNPRWELWVLLRENGSTSDASVTHLRRYLELAPDGTHARDARAALGALSSTSAGSSVAQGVGP